MALQSKLRSLLDLIPIEKGDVGSMTCAIYDTAWVSMVAKETEMGKIWLFPQSFSYIINSQLPDGSWPSYAAEVDGILNTAASLLTLKAHQANPYQIIDYSDEEISRRVSSGSDALCSQLKVWDVGKAVHVGFEILVPTLLTLLEEQGVSFDFPGRGTLMELNHLKLAKFKVDYLYSPIKTTALHSLEAFAGKLDYEKVRHHKTFGAYMASPSSTAACLMYSSWDNESEEYLRWTLAAGTGRGSGGVPSAFPSTYFEVTWVLTTVLESGFTIEDIGIDRAAKFAAFLRKSLDEQNGVIGFAPSVGVDVDDTAKTLLALSLLGQPVSHQGLLDEFEVKTHFRTYQGERNPSFSANCNVLVALLSQPDVFTLAPQITKVASFLNRAWWDSNGIIDDKWNLSEFYPSMLMAEAFSNLLEVWGRGKLSDLPTTLIVDEIMVSLYQVLVGTLMRQNSNGSWGDSNSREVTAYATLTISKASVLPFIAPIRSQIDKSIQAAQEFLLSTTDIAPSYLWVEKVTYGSIVLTESYVLAALNATLKQPLTLSWKISSLATTSSADIERLYQTCFKTPLFPKEAAWKVQAAFIESCLYRPYLQRLAKGDVAGIGINGDDKVFEVIPFVWTVCNYSKKEALTTTKLRHKMSIALLERQLQKSCNGRMTNGKTKSDEFVNGKSGYNQSINGETTNGKTSNIELPNGNSGHRQLITTETSMESQACEWALELAAVVVQVPNELTYLLPDGFTGDLHNTFFQSTTTSSASINALLKSASKSVFTYYDDSFAQVVGPKASAQLLINRPGSGAFYELGAYISSLDEVWFTSTFTNYPSPGFITAYNMRTHEFRNITQVPYGAGGYYFSGDVYIGGLSPGAGVVAVNPHTLSTTTIFNSYFGLPISLVDDLVWVSPPGSKKSYLFFTVFFTGLEPGATVPKLDRPVALPNGVWRWDPQEKVLLPVISRLDIAIPNGIRVSPDQKILYITDSLSTGAGGVAEGNQGYAPTAGPNIYAYDLNDAGLPVNRRLFGLARSGYADGIHVDDAGRVWTAEGEGIVVRSASGKVLGVFNAAAFGIDASRGVQIANFALAGNMLFIGAFDSLYAVELAQVVASGQC